MTEKKKKLTVLPGNNEEEKEEVDNKPGMWPARRRKRLHPTQYPWRATPNLPKTILHYKRITPNCVVMSVAHDTVINLLKEELPRMRPARQRTRMRPTRCPWRAPPRESTRDSACQPLLPAGEIHLQSLQPYLRQGCSYGYPHRFLVRITMGKARAFATVDSSLSVSTTASCGEDTPSEL